MGVVGGRESVGVVGGGRECVGVVGRERVCGCGGEGESVWVCWEGESVWVCWEGGREGGCGCGGGVWVWCGSVEGGGVAVSVGNIPPPLQRQNKLCLLSRNIQEIIPKQFEHSDLFKMFVQLCPKCIHPFSNQPTGLLQYMYISCE